MQIEAIVLNRTLKRTPSEEQYRGAGGSSSGSPPASLLVVPQPLTAKPTHSSHLNPHIGGPHPPRKYQCKMCPQEEKKKGWKVEERGKSDGGNKN
ncbi:hypothetical protein PV327_009510 [Microctonus hyperodae]|uniref:Uncharacterized protein n=1 Tax=Microctonus hyperodae TaxID=165561 RepID=A0AA39FU72_MICHY|nr:hypothetical protein PV327_009510 [Microctonus hyperodae]